MLNPRVFRQQLIIVIIFLFYFKVADAQQQTFGGTRINFLVDGHPGFVVQPPTSAPKGRKPWAWYAPTIGNYPNKSNVWLFERLVQRGFWICGMDVGESMGNPAGCRLFSMFYDTLMIKYHLDKKGCLIPQSRGGLMLYNWAAEHPDSVACIAGIYPVCNPGSYPGLKSAAGAYGMTEAQLAARLADHNPIDRLAPLAKARVPIYHIHGDSDAVVPLDRNSGPLAQRYKELSGEMTLNVVKGRGHDMWEGWFQCQALVDFVIAHAPKSGDAPPAK